MDKIYQLQVVDFICGVNDRSSRNFVLELQKNEDDTLSLAGISGRESKDAFGADMMPWRTAKDRTSLWRERNLEGMSADYRPAYGIVLMKAFLCIPLHIAQKVEAISDEDITNGLTGLVSDLELDTTLLRLRALQEHIRAIQQFDFSNAEETAQCALITSLQARALKIATNDYFKDLSVTIGLAKEAQGNYFATMGMYLL
jgi:hypothetical protein